MEKIKLILIYILIYVVCSAAFVALFHTNIFGNMDVLMTRGVIFILFTGILSGILMYLLKKKKSIISNRDIVTMPIIFICINMMLFTLIPVTVERSISVFMLSNMNNNPGISVEEIEKDFNIRYMEKFGAFDKRIEEQLSLGNIKKIDNGGYALTKRGENIVKAFQITAELFNTDKRIVNEE